MAPDEQRYTDEGAGTVEVDLFRPVEFGKLPMDQVELQTYGQNLHA